MLTLKEPERSVEACSFAVDRSDAGAELAGKQANRAQLVCQTQRWGG